MKKLIVIMMIFTLSIGSVNAGFFSDIWDFFVGDDNVSEEIGQVHEDSYVQNIGTSVPGSNSGMNDFKLLGKKIKSKQDYDLSSTTTIPLDVGTIYGFSIDTKIDNMANGSLVRFVLTDGAEVYQVLETYPRLHGKGVISLNNICEETCALEGFTPTELIVEIINADVEISNFYYLNDDTELKANANNNIANYKKTLNKAQNNYKIEALQNNEWTAGETSVSHLTYAEKKRLIGINKSSILNLQGFEYYKGGVFNVPSATTSFTTDTISTPTSTSYPSSWDWRNRHGENWHSSIKNQGNCGSCAIFAATGATEHLVNIYYNQHLDLNLAEQDGVSCGGGSCQGAYPYRILDYYTSTGVVDENAFPYKAIDASGCSYSSCTYTPVTCDQKSSTPTEKVKISGRTAFSYSMGEDTLKEMIVNGAVSGGLRSMSHAMAMSGWKTDTDGATIWIFKNSWGSGWGESGYANMKVDISDFAWTHSLNPEITSTMGDYEIACVDKDGDNYCNWGIGADKPASCPSTCNELKDCDDSNPNLGPFDVSYNCIALEGCSDTDSGLNYDISGTITGSTSGTDSCVDSTSLKEYYCTANNTGSYEIHECPFMCVNGACVEPTCSDTDGGLNYDLLGAISGTVSGTDSCVDSNILKEYYCDGNIGAYEVHNCSLMCADGACVEPTCSDSDGGSVYDTYGYITGYMAFGDESRDICLDDKTLQEAYCYNSMGYVETYTCDDICQNGQCVEAVYPTVSVTYPADNANVADKFLIITADATNAVSVDFYINGNFISSDSSAPFAANKVNTRGYPGTNTIRVVATSSSNIKAEATSIFTVGSSDDGGDEEPTPTTPECNDGKDNDGDKTCDYNGCAKNKAIWYPADPNCSGPDDTSESS